VEFPVLNCEVREKTNKMQQLDIYYQYFLNMFRASLCPSSGEQDLCYCTCCTALVLLDVVGSGCGALRCGVRALFVTKTYSFLGIKFEDCVYSLYYIHFSQHSCIIKAEVKATCFDLKSHRQAKLRTMKFFTMWDPKCAQPHFKELRGS